MIVIYSIPSGVTSASGECYAKLVSDEIDNLVSNTITVSAEIKGF